MRSKQSLPKLLIVGPTPPPFIGPAVATERLAQSPSLARSFEVRLVDTRDEGGESDIGRLTLHNVMQGIAQFARFLRVLIAWRPDAVYMSIARGMWGFLRDTLLILPARLFGARVLIHLRAGRFDLIHDNGVAGRLLARIGLGAVDRALVLGETTRDIFGAYVPPDRVRVVPNGMNLERWPRCDAPSPSRAEIRVVYLANLFHNKGAHILLRALPAVIDAAPNVRVTFAGEWFDRSYRDLCMNIVEEHRLQEIVAFPGVVTGTDKRELLKRADVLVFAPVAPEGAPWVVLEAMASSLPVIGTPQGTMSETILDGETGCIVPPNDPKALAISLVRLAADPELRRRMGAAGRHRVEAIFEESRTHDLLARVVMESVGGHA